MKRFTRGGGREAGLIAPINATKTATVAEIQAGLITSTSPAAVSITTPTATELAAYPKAQKGFQFDLMIDNSGGANVVTLVPGAGLTAASALTGGTTLTTAAGVISMFRVTFTSATAAVISRIF